MNTKFFILFLAGVVVLASSCSVYKQGQTPDDVYYSPAREQNEYIAYKQDKPGRYRAEEDYYSEDDFRNDRFLRLSIGNPYYYSAMNSFYWNDWMYYGGIGSPWYSPVNSYWYWNSYYNPYYHNIYYPSYPFYPGKPIIGGGDNSKPLYKPNLSLSSYTNKTYSNSNRYLNSSNFDNRSNSSNRSNGRTITNSSSNYYNRQYRNNNNSSQRVERVYTPPASNSSSNSGSYGSGSGSSGSGSSNGGRVTRPIRN